MTDIRAFIKNLGKAAPDFFGVSPDTISRWIKTGNVPIKKAEKIYAAMEALTKSQLPPEPAPAPPTVALSPGEDPYTHLPKDIDRRLPEIQSVAGRLPETIEINPTEQSFGNNFTRPGRVTYAPMPPMKLRDEGGQKVAYVDNEPKTPTVLPPSIANEGWTAKSEPIPAPRKTENVSSRPI